MSPQEDSENPPCNNDPLSAGVDVGNHDEDLDLDTPPQTAALLSHKFHPYRHPHTHHPLHLHTHHLQAAVTVHSVDAECWSCPPVTPNQPPTLPLMPLLTSSTTSIQALHPAKTRESYLPTLPGHLLRRSEVFVLVEHGGEHLTSVEVIREWIWQVHVRYKAPYIFFLFFFFPRNNEDERIIFLLFI